MSPDNGTLLSFLSRPRTLEEVAKRLGISSSEAERLVIRAVESGEILISSQIVGRSAAIIRTPPTAGTNLKSGLLKGRGGTIGLVRFGGSRVRGKTGTVGRGPSFKLRRDKASTVRKTPVHLQTWELLARRKAVASENGRVSLSERMRVLEVLSLRSRSLDELRVALGISRDTVERFVRNGFLRCDWGPKGVGNFYKITPGGIRELRRLKTASSLDSRIVRKGLISVKTTIPQMTC